MEHIILILSTSVFFAIVFIQSGLDKLMNWKGNLNWLMEYFGKSPLKNMVPLMLGIATMLEVCAGVLSGIGAIIILLNNNTSIAYYGIIFANISLLCLFFGQRMAKDYPGAAGLVPYFILSLLGLYFFSYFLKPNRVNYRIRCLIHIKTYNYE